MSTSVEVAPSQLRRTVFIPPIFFFLVLIVIGPAAQYLPPVFRPLPPQTIISLPVQIAVKNARPDGALVVLVAVQLLALGLYLPPVFKTLDPSEPPQTIISLSVHIAVRASRRV